MSDINQAIASASTTGAEAIIDSMAEQMNYSAMQATAVGVAVATGATVTVKRILTHPVAIFGLGCVLGYIAYQYRNEIRSMVRRKN